MRTTKRIAGTAIPITQPPMNETPFATARGQVRSSRIDAMGIGLNAIPIAYGIASRTRELSQAVRARPLSYVTSFAKRESSRTGSKSLSSRAVSTKPS